MNKVEQIRKEIERRHKWYKDEFEKYSHPFLAADIAAKAEETESILSFIDSLQDKCDGCNNIRSCITCVDGSEWAHYEEPELQFKVGDTIRSKVWESAVHEIVFMDDSAYFFENGYMVRFADQEQWELAEESVSEDLEKDLNTYIQDNFTIDKEQLDRFGIEPKDYLYSMTKDDMLKMVRNFTYWQKERVIDKACAWLSNVCIEDMICKYDDFDTSEGWYKFIEDFKKYIEE